MTRFPREEKEHGKPGTGWQPTYTAAHHDLAITYEAKMEEDPDHAADWCHKALASWRQVYALGPEDAAFSADYLLTIGQRIRWLGRQCG
jgi:hypothetical protein